MAAVLDKGGSPRHHAFKEVKTPMRKLCTMAFLVALLFPIAAHATCQAPITFTPTIDPNHGGTTIMFGGQTNCIDNLGMTYVRLVVEIHSKTFWGWSAPMKTLLQEATHPNITLTSTVQCVNGISQYWVSSRVDWQDSSGAYYNVSQNFGNFPCPTP
jgi:hypothetical protein